MTGEAVTCVKGCVPEVESIASLRADHRAAPTSRVVFNVPTYQRTNVPTSSAGFTLIELLIVLTLITILATIGMTQYRSSVIYARESVLKEDLFRMRDAIDQYYADKNKWPSTIEELVSDGYLRKVPDDPFTKSNSTWVPVPAEPDPSNPTAEAGVYDVKSGSDVTALDGTKYSEW
jgi:general secretion pathway protein G